MRRHLLAARNGISGLSSDMANAVQREAELLIAQLRQLRRDPTAAAKQRNNPNGVKKYPNSFT
jgi:hypothetical protein